MIAQLDPLYVRHRPWKVWSRVVSYALFEGRPVTTRGRWINPVLFRLFAMGKHLPQLKRVDKPVFIIGTGRSGTTILGKVLSMHREVGFLNEPKAMWHSIYPNEDLIGSYSRSDALYRLSELDVTDQVIRNAHRLFGAYLAITFSKRVVDKYPELIFRVPFVRAVFPDARFLFLVRNGWDTNHSIKDWSSRLGKQVGDEIHDWWGVNRRKWDYLVTQLVPEHADLLPEAERMRSWTNHVDMAAVEWILAMREGLGLLAKYPEDVLRVTYEELCRSPRRVLEQITDFLDLAKDDTSLFSYGEKVLKPVPSKEPLRLEQSLERPFQETMQKLGYVEEA